MFTSLQIMTDTTANNRSQRSPSPHSPKNKKGPRWPYPNIQAPPEYGIRLPSFKERRSLLDEQALTSRLNQSEFRGFFNLTIIFGIFFLFTKPVLNFLQLGHFFSPYLYNTFKNDYFVCIMLWPLFYFWSFTSFLIQKAILMGLSDKLRFVLQHLSQTGMFVFAIGIIVKKNWCATHSAFVIMQTCCHFMKMHSYSTTNRDYRAEAKEAKLNGRKPMTSYPDNVNFINFTQFLWTPVLTYCEKYPRLKHRDILYIIKKSIITILSIMAGYIIHTDYLMAQIQQGSNIGYIELIMRCIFPITILLILLFYIVFENILNVFGELTKFADRQFYDEWWNSSTFEEFNRLWNKPVHNFLYRHVYLECMVKYRLGKQVAQLMTFFFSALLHQLLLALIFKTIRPILLCFMLAQIPLFYTTKWMRGTVYGNYFVWFGMIIGPSIIVCGYLKIDENVTNFFTRVPILK